jgi:hypothetical protein
MLAEDDAERTQPEHAEHDSPADGPAVVVPADRLVIFAVDWVGNGRAPVRAGLLLPSCGPGRLDEPPNLVTKRERAAAPPRRYDRPR